MCLRGKSSHILLLISCWPRVQMNQHDLSCRAAKDCASPIALAALFWWLVRQEYVGLAENSRLCNAAMHMMSKARTIVRWGSLHPHGEGVLICGPHHAERALPAVPRCVLVVVGWRWRRKDRFRRAAAPMDDPRCPQASSHGPRCCPRLHHGPPCCYTVQRSRSRGPGPSPAARKLCGIASPSRSAALPLR